MVQGDLIVREWAGAMRGTVIAGGILCASIVASGLPAVALPLSEFNRVYRIWCARRKICLLTSIPTQASPITDATRLAELRTRLPDTFACGRCRYDLAGDATAAYYLRTCRLVGGLDAARKRRTRRGLADVNKQRTW